MISPTERVLFVHAHPDDESISTGGTIATLVDAGAAVTVLTCTRGELGEIVDPSLAIAGPAELSLARERELASALAILGVDDHRILGTAEARWQGAPPRVYVDSGMQWGANGAEPLDVTATDSFTSVAFGEVAADIAAVIVDVQADAVVSYNARGGYGHPDHIRAGEAARRAAEVMGVPFWQIVDVGSNPTVVVDAASVLHRKRAALLEYRSQLVVGDDWFAGANGEREPIAPVEYFARVTTAADTGSSYAEQTVALKVFTTLVSVLLGAGAGLVLTAAHQSSVWAAVGGIVFAGALIAGLRIVFSSRIVAGVAAVAFLIAGVALTFGGSAGDLLQQQQTLGILWICGTAAVIALALSVPRIGRRARG